MSAAMPLLPPAYTKNVCTIVWFLSKVVGTNNSQQTDKNTKSYMW